MKYSSIILAQLAAVTLASNGQDITLAEPNKFNKNHIGHTHVFSKNKQTIFLNIYPPLQKNLSARLYRTANNTAIGIGNPVSIQSTGKSKSSVTINFPKSKHTTHYTLAIQTLPIKYIHITAHPEDLLSPLIKASQNQPIQLYKPPAKLTSIFHQFSIPFRVLGNLDSVSEGMLILFHAKNIKLTNLKSHRIIIADPAEINNNEIWKSSKLGQWKITVPAHYLDPQHLKTAAGQYQLKKILLTEPK